MPRNRSKPKLKLKTHRGAAKRFKITGTGKLLRMHIRQAPSTGNESAWAYAQAQEDDQG